MKTSFVLCVSFLLCSAPILSGCQDDKNAVQGTPEISDINNIMIQGKRFTAHEYMKAFCVIPKADEDKNCVLAADKASRDMSKIVKVEW